MSDDVMSFPNSTYIYSFIYYLLDFLFVSHVLYYLLLYMNVSLLTGYSVYRDSLSLHLLIYFIPLVISSPPLVKTLGRKSDYLNQRQLP